MFPYNEIVLVLCGLLGVLFNSLITLDNLQELAIKANVSFKGSEYIKRDKYAICASVLAVGVFYLIFGEVSRKLPYLNDVQRVSFFTLGATGSVVFQKLLGRARRAIFKVIDEKTNIADGKKDD